MDNNTSKYKTFSNASKYGLLGMAISLLWILFSFCVLMFFKGSIAGETIRDVNAPLFDNVCGEIIDIFVKLKIMNQHDAIFVFLVIVIIYLVVGYLAGYLVGIYFCLVRGVVQKVLRNKMPAETGLNSVVDKIRCCDEEMGLSKGRRKYIGMLLTSAFFIVPAAVLSVYLWQRSSLVHNAKCESLAKNLLQNEYWQKNRPKDMQQAVSMLTNGVVDKTPMLLITEINASLSPPPLPIEGIDYKGAVWCVIVRYLDEGQAVKAIQLRSDSGKVVGLQDQAAIRDAQREDNIDYLFTVEVYDNKELWSKNIIPGLERMSVYAAPEDLSGMLEGKWEVILLDDKDIMVGSAKLNIMK